MDIGTIQQVDIDGQMRTAYLDYAMSVIVARAIPDARHGLKPVHRRILYAMHDMGIRANTPYKKSARIVGEVLGKYHPHGDSAVYEAMARMAQDFSMRYMLVDGQGNFGSIDGDAPAAMRYTEARLARMADEILADLDQNTVDFVDNFDGSLKEPSVLPARLPNLLLNGSSGIAVGMATNIPPHNLGELVNALTYLIDNFSQEDGTVAIDEVMVEDLMKYLPGPDFPTGGVIVGSEGILQTYSTGRGRIVLRGLAHIEEMSGGRNRIVITEIPYQLNKTTLLERIAELVRTGKLDEITDLRDESDRRGMSVIIELKRGAAANKVLNQLYKYTPLQSTFGAQMLALVGGEPRLLTLKRALQVYLLHRQQVIERRSRYELDKARARAHILEGLLIALANLDEVIKTIRESPDADVAKERLITRFKLSELQAQAILDMQLRRLASLERQKIQNEHQELMVHIAYLEDLLAHPRKILDVIKTDLAEMAEKYGDKRRTHIAVEVSDVLREEDLVHDEDVLISFTQRGYIKRVPASSFKIQARGGRGVAGHATRDEDAVLMLVPARTLDTLLFFSDRGKVYSEKAYQIPEVDRAGRGVSVVNVLSLEAGETITSAVSLSKFSTSEYCIMATVSGRIKRIALSELASVRPSGLIAISLEEGDLLGWAHLTHGNDDVILISARGKALRFSETKVRAMGRQAAGVAAMRLEKGDRLASMGVVEPQGDLLIVTENGFGKRTALSAYPRKGRATGGVFSIDQKALDKIGLVAAARVVQASDDVTIITTGGLTLRTHVKEIKEAGRGTRGVHLIDIGEGDKVASLARIPAASLPPAGSDQDGAGPQVKNGQGGS
ncbi:MAG TPA: DNA gyrase subunit A [Anaerolineaceae bacterium]